MCIMIWILMYEGNQVEMVMTEQGVKGQQSKELIAENDCSSSEEETSVLPDLDSDEEEWENDIEARMKDWERKLNSQTARESLKARD
jgi:hypothetical protein